jgi:hypothetical protein
MQISGLMDMQTDAAILSLNEITAHDFQKNNLNSIHSGPSH